VFNDAAETVRLETAEPHEALARLHARDRQHVFLEGGPHLAAAFLRAGLVDEVVGYLAPALLGAGSNAVADLGIATMADAQRLELAEAVTVGTGSEANVRITMTPMRSAPHSTPVERD
jgi:diaminohydroxyphosphoribosylaminopyrimidine deaminase/5-amino-6-(5-phosphoribosylamino)uracil reductase